MIQKLTKLSNILLIFILCLLILFYFQYTSLTKSDLIFPVTQTILTLNFSCILPQMSISNRSNLPQHLKLSCQDKPKNIVEIKNAKFKLLLNNTARCVYKLILSLNDNETILEEAQPIKHGDNIPGDFFKVFCYSNSSFEKIIFEMKYLAVKPLEEIAKQRMNLTSKVNALQYNVAMLGFDSMSRISFIENLPAVYELFIKEMNGTVFEKHTIVGDGSTPNILAATTGQAIKELLKSYKTVDDYPLIYKNFQQNGYINLFFDDANKEWGTYQKFQSGFHRSPPIDHYMRPFLVDGLVPFGCVGSLPSYKMYMNLLHEMYTVYPEVKKFLFLFQEKCSHDNNQLMQSLEPDLIENLKEFRAGGKFDNTILFLFSDHGIRYSEKRKTIKGKYEERLPFLGIYLPESLQKERPDLLQILKSNSKHLTSHFDIYATLLHILGEEMPKTNQSRSLFTPLRDRSCSEAGIEDHWCMCHHRTALSNNDNRALSAARATLSEINKKTNGLRQICSELSVMEIKYFEQLTVNERVLDHFFAVKASKIIYTVIFTATPGDALFESTVSFDIQKQTYYTDESKISRTNRYAPWIKCLNYRYNKIHKFCICKDAL